MPGKDVVTVTIWNKRQALGGFCAMILIIMSFLPLSGFGEPASATDKPTVTAGQTTTNGEKEKKPEEGDKADAQGRPILGEGETGILMEAKTGTILFEAESRKRMYPASTTKIMTALVAMDALEAGEVTLEEEIEVTAAMLEGLDPDGSNMELVAGEILSFERLLQGLMIPSGNDAAMAIAYRIAGSAEAYVERMNARAAELMLKDTHFVNTHGLHDENHYTTAADMAVMAQAAMKNETFRNIVDIVHIKIPPTNKKEKQRYYINTNGLLSTMRYREYYYNNSTGIKTGRTSQAGNCLVSSASNKGMDLIGVVFGGKEVTNSHKDTARMLDYGFNQFEIMEGAYKGEILGEIKVKQAKTKDTVTLSAGAAIPVVVPIGTTKDALEIHLNLPESLYAPLAKGQEVAEVSVVYQGQELGKGKLCVDVNIERSFFWPALALGEWLWSMTAVRILVYLVLAVIVVLAFIMIAGLRNELKRARLQKKRRNRSNGGK